MMEMAEVLRVLKVGVGRARMLRHLMFFFFLS